MKKFGYHCCIKLFYWGQLWLSVLDIALWQGTFPSKCNAHFNQISRSAKENANSCYHPLLLLNIRSCFIEVNSQWRRRDDGKSNWWKTQITTLLFSIPEKRCRMSHYIVCQTQYAKKTKMSSCIRLYFAVFKPACFPGYSDPQSSDDPWLLRWQLINRSCSGRWQGFQISTTYSFVTRV